MNPEVAFVLGCFGIGFTIGYMIWAEIRPHVLRIGLASLRDRVNARMRAEGKADDPQLARLNEIINHYIENARYMNAAIGFLRRRCPRLPGPGREVAQLASEIYDGNDKALQFALIELSLRLVLHLFFGSISGWCLTLNLGFLAATGQFRKAVGRIVLLVSANEIDGKSAPSGPIRPTLQA